MAVVLQDNVALIAVLEALDPPQPEGANRRQLICIANTHIHANPELNDVKLWQVQLLFVLMICMHASQSPTLVRHSHFTASDMMQLHHVTT